ncbi:hypothetical protein CRE_09352 [Caenorhabditis remanei]|uniref:F-box domain-containing protein n=1 Tax=Caenorhabditis remanei TaxID=31234 RepID=E3LIC0_CAERE|nr:hypothetical protein CRE_09352 [Caenorhabditis remanei]
MYSKLVEMPDVVLSTILQTLDFRSIQSLKKVCRTFRNFINEMKCDYNLLGVSMFYSSTIIELWLRTDDRYLKFFYQPEADGCLMLEERRLEPPDRKIMVQSKDFVDVFLGDFQNLMDHQKDEMADKWMKGIQSVLKSRPRILRVENLQMLILSQYDVLRVLPHIHPMFLRRIWLNHTVDWPQRNLAIDKVVDLEQWKNSYEVGIYRCVIIESIRSFTHFSKVELVLKECCLEMLYDLKKDLCNSYYFERFKLYIDMNKHKLPRKRCFTRQFDCDQVLEVSVYDMNFSRNYKRIIISRLPLIFVPRKVVKKKMIR